MYLSQICTKDILCSLSKTYCEVYFINLPKDEFYTIKSNYKIYEIQDIKSFCYSDAIIVRLIEFINPNEREIVKNFFDINSIYEDLKTKDVISLQYKRKTVNGYELVQSDIILNNLDDNGIPETAIWAIKNINAPVHSDDNPAKLPENCLEQIKQACEAKNGLLSGMSHDIRTPINSILGMATIASNNINKKEKVEDCIDKIILSGRHLLNMINDILDISSLEEQQIVPHNEKYFNIIELINNTITILQPSIDEKQHNFSFYQDNIIHTDVFGDSIKVQRIIFNLISNSIKYTEPNGTINMFISEKKSDKNDLFCYELIFSDNGVGIPEDFLSRIFVPFERADIPSTYKTEGKGLGMTITKQLIESLNGTINIKSKLNVGTNIIVTLYLSPGNNMTDKKKEKSFNAPLKDSLQLLSSDLSSKNILVAEDNELNTEVIYEMLSVTKANIFTASNGQEALDKYLDSEEHFFDLILMDVKMPVLDGYETTTRIRASKRTDSLSIPIIAMTAYAFAEDYHHALHCGMNDHVSKPLVIKSLINTIMKYL